MQKSQGSPVHRGGGCSGARKSNLKGMQVVLPALLVLGGIGALRVGAKGDVGTEPIPTEAMTVTVQQGARQTFQGFGASIVNWRGDYQKLTMEERSRGIDYLP